jgi:hypothetical protein
MKSTKKIKQPIGVNRKLHQIAEEKKILDHIMILHCNNDLSKKSVTGTR